MKKGQIYEGIVIDVNFPDKAVVLTKETDKNGIINEYHVVVKGALPGQTVKYILQKARAGKCKGRLLEVIGKSPDETAKPACAGFGICGGCSYQTLPYQAQLELKKNQVLKLLNGVLEEGSYIFDGIFPSPCIWGYRNKMEFSFGDEYKGGPLSLGLHKKGSIHDIVNASGCKIVNNDYSKILDCVREYFLKRNIPHYNKNTHTGILRHLLVRRSVSTGEILVALVTTSGLESGKGRDAGNGIIQGGGGNGENTGEKNISGKSINERNINWRNCDSAGNTDNIDNTGGAISGLDNLSVNGADADTQDKNIIHMDGLGLYSDNICTKVQDGNNVTIDKPDIDKQAGQEEYKEQEEYKRQEEYKKQEEYRNNYADCLYGLGLELQHLGLEGRIAGFLHIINDGLGDVVKSDETHIIFGKDWITEEILGLKFRISVFSFFQTNTKGAEVLYSCARNYILGKPAAGTGSTMEKALDMQGVQSIQQGTMENAEEEIKGVPEGQIKENDGMNISESIKESTKESTGKCIEGNIKESIEENIGKNIRKNIRADSFLKDKTVFDLYSGTGTIAQIIAPIAKKVTGVEIVEEAVEAAKQNAEYNGLGNCEFIAGDVLKVLEETDEKPDFIILDPPREGVNPKALKKIGGEMKVPGMVYISCKPTSLARDIEELQKYGYKARRVCCVDMFPQTGHIEAVVLIQRRDT